ncbi:MAG: hypothetical protein ACFFG0_02405 [Candidatus Thorarchaeota archaeon]
MKKKTILVEKNVVTITEKRYNFTDELGCMWYYCPNCEGTIGRGDNYCPNCGAIIVWELK